MLPGLTPFLGSVPPPITSVTVFTPAWSGSPGSYSSNLGSTVVGGTPPYTYAWTIDNGLGTASFVDPTVQNPTAISPDNAVASVQVLVTDVNGQTRLGSGTITAV